MILIILVGLGFLLLILFVLHLFCFCLFTDKIQVLGQDSSMGLDFVNFDLTNKTITRQGYATGKIEEFSNGWFRISATMKAISTSNLLGGML